MSTGQRIVVCNMNGQKRTTVVGIMTWVRVQHNILNMESQRENTYRTQLYLSPINQGTCHLIFALTKFSLKNPKRCTWDAMIRSVVVVLINHE